MPFIIKIILIAPLAILAAYVWLVALCMSLDVVTVGRFELTRKITSRF